MFSSARALHQVLKIGSLKDNILFFRDKLKMTVLRHEVFGEGCKASCNGPYDGQWTKTMIGYGPESGNPNSYFVLELTYNYAVKEYKLGNDLKHIHIVVEDNLLNKIIAEQKESLFENINDQKALVLKSPDGYKFLISSLPYRLNKITRQDIVEVCLTVSNLEKSLDFWQKTLELKLEKQFDDYVILSYNVNEQACLRLVQIDKVDRAEAYGRTAFSLPGEKIVLLEKLLRKLDYKILVPYVSLDTPGKATVEVVICADPDGHEICFVGDEGFRKLSQPDENIENLYF